MVLGKTFSADIFISNVFVFFSGHINEKFVAEIHILVSSF